MPSKGLGHGAPGVPRPQVWKIGPDYERHKMYDPWLKAKAQSDYRVRQGLELGHWKLSFEDFFQLWRDHWHLRGRAVDDKCLTRIDPSKDWTKKNCEIISRRQHLENQGHGRKKAITKKDTTKKIKIIK